MKLRFVNRSLTVADVKAPIENENILTREDITLKEIEVDREDLAILYANASYIHGGEVRQIAGKYYDIDEDTYVIMIYTIVEQTK